MVDACGEFVVALKQKQPPRWLSLLGHTGTGKTHCAERVWNYACAQASWSRSVYIARKIYWPEFVEDLRGGKAYDQLADMRAWPVLFLDDVGAERDHTGFASEKLNTLLGCRHSLWTIITSNLSLENFGRIDPRIADRLIRPPNLFVEIEAESFAVLKLKGKL